MLILIYMVLGYWATGKTIYSNKVLIGSWSGIFLQRMVTGFLLGWILIPVAIIKLLFAK